MAMLTVYADESGTDGRSPIVAVGGYVSTQPVWDDFQNAWNEMRIEKGIDKGVVGCSASVGWRRDRA